MTCIILDDEPSAIDVLKRYASDTPSLQLKGTFRNPLKALDFLRQEQIDLIFLDITMPNLTGIQFLQALTTKPMIVFTTAHSSYAAESYELNAVDYLVKPVVVERFHRAVSKALEIFRRKDSPRALSSEGDYLLLKSGVHTHRVRAEQILFVSKESNYLEVHTTDKKILIRANMNDIFQWLPETLFCRVHKSFVVNLSHVEVIETHQLRAGKELIPIGSTYREDFLRRLK